MGHRYAQSTASAMHTATAASAVASPKTRCGPAGLRNMASVIELRVTVLTAIIDRMSDCRCRDARYRESHS